MRKIKIIRIIARLNIGGPAIHTVLLTEGLNKNRFDTILVAGIPHKNEGDMNYFARERNIDVFVIPELCRNINFFNDLIAFFKIFNLIRKENPDIVHTHTAKAGILGRVAGIFYNLTTNNKCRLVHTFHGHVFYGYFSKFKSGLYIQIEKFLARFTDKIITVSENLRRELIQFGIGSEDKIITIYLGLELDKYLNINELKDSKRTYKLIGIIGRLVPIKNHRMFLDIAKAVIKKFTKYSMRFLIVGGGELKSDLIKYVHSQELDNFVEFVDWQKDLSKIYQQLDIVCLTSINEGTPLSLIEAMAAAKPIVATDVGGIRDLVGPVCKTMGLPVSIILSGSNNREVFVKNLISLLDDELLSRKIGEAGRKFVREMFTKERLVKDLEVLYNSIFKQRREN